MSNNTAIDPLDMPAGEQDEPSFPVLRKGTKRMEIRSVEKKTFPGKDGKPDTDCLIIGLAITEDDRSTEGQPLNKGFGFNAQIFMTPNERNTAKQIGEQLAMPIKAALGVAAAKSVTPRMVIIDPSLLIGKVVDVQVDVKKAKEGSGYGDSNIVRNWIVPA